MKVEFNVPDELNRRSVDLIQGFAEAMAEKMRKAELKYGYTDEWMNPYWEVECRNELYRHLFKGDPVDVAIYCAFMSHHGWHIVR